MRPLEPVSPTEADLGALPQVPTQHMQPSRRGVVPGKADGGLCWGRRWAPARTGDPGYALAFLLIDLCGSVTVEHWEAVPGTHVLAGKGRWIHFQAIPPAQALQ